MEEQNNFQEPQQNISSPADPDTYTKNAQNIQNLVDCGILNPQQGQYYMSQLAKNSERLEQDTNINSAEIVNAFDEFNKEKPDFFNSDGRSDVLNYLKNAKVNMDKDEINIISEMVEKIEKCAIERYVQQQNHERTLNNENEAAKERLLANAQDSNFSANKNKVFTREQIGRMSSAEFARNESLIMDQLRKGQIR